MRIASLALALLLPLTPFLTLQFLAKYPSLIVYVGLVIVALVGVVGLVRGRGVGYAGLVSALISSLLSIKVVNELVVPKGVPVLQLARKCQLVRKIVVQ